MTPLQQNCSLIWCTQTNKAALIDPGGDLDKLKAGVAKAGVELEKILITHGHLDHCGQAGMLAKELGLPIEGPHEADRFWIARLDEDGARFQMEAASFEPDRWLEDGDTVTVSFAWTMGGNTLSSTSDTLQGPFQQGDIITCTVTPNDGTDDGPTNSASVTVGADVEGATGGAFCAAAGSGTDGSGTGGGAR